MEKHSLRGRAGWVAFLIQKALSELKHLQLQAICMSRTSVSIQEALAEFRHLQLQATFIH
eukprot:1561872-Lingulodinium_polyedra.AAC.1